MNKSELVDAIAKDTGLSKKDSEAALKSIIENISKELSKGHEVALIGFGTFAVGKRAATLAGSDLQGAVTSNSCIS